ncbi:MAG: replication-relaxation family protein [Solirubrobacterales bacterium]|nr:replication-relaxation family protein [Solirubrobacterales bacterium]
MRARDGLPQTAVEILTSLASHRTLTTAQVWAIHLPDRTVRRARQVLGDLQSAGLVLRVRAPGALPRGLWFVTESGARLAVESGRLDRAPKVLSPEQAAGQLRLHTIAVNAAAICFLEEARHRGDDFGPLSWHHEVVHPLTRGRGRYRKVLRADAVLTYLRLDDGEVFVEQRFVEVDRATLSVDSLAAELASYARLFRASDDHGEPLWRATYPAFPPVVCVLDGAPRAALERRRNATIALLASDPELVRTPEVSIHTCLAGDLAEQGPFAPIFRDPTRPGESLNWLGTPADPEGRSA